MDAKSLRRTLVVGLDEGKPWWWASSTVQSWLNSPTQTGGTQGGNEAAAWEVAKLVGGSKLVMESAMLAGAGDEIAGGVDPVLVGSKAWAVVSSWATHRGRVRAAMRAAERGE